MFCRSFKIKSCSQMKNTERRNSIKLLQEEFPNLPDEVLLKLLPMNSSFSMKITTHSGQRGNIVLEGKQPLFAQIEGILYPTVYTCWTIDCTYFNCTKTVIIDNVFDYLSRGADLMLPGVVNDLANEINPSSRITLIYTVSSPSVIAIGQLLMTKDDIMRSNGKGRVVKILHMYKDKLWEHGNCRKLPSHAEEDHEDSESESIAEEGNSSDVVLSSEEMDELLEKCFLYALKCLLKKSDLPIVFSTFYRKFIIEGSPLGSKCDIKKTSFKKLNKFLQQKSSTALIEILEVKEGVNAIVSVDFKHEDIKSFNAQPFKDAIEKNEEISKCASSKLQSLDEYTPPTLSQMYCLTADALLFFSKYKKGDFLSPSEARSEITSYVKRECSITESHHVVLDPNLYKFLSKKNENIDVLPWPEIFSRFFSKLTLAYSMQRENEPIQYVKASIPKISIRIQRRGGNKKVTIVTGLDKFLLDPQVFAHEVQVTLSVSASVSDCYVGKEVIIQGDQTEYLTMLFHKLHIPKNCLIFP